MAAATEAAVAAPFCVSSASSAGTGKGGAGPGHTAVSCSRRGARAWRWPSRRAPWPPRCKPAVASSSQRSPLGSSGSPSAAPSPAPPWIPALRLPIVVFFHGGAFLVHTAASPLYHKYAAAAPAIVVSVDYRLNPEHLLPATYDDAFAALKAVVAACRMVSAFGGEEAEPWLAAHGDASRIVLAGGSAGANVVHNAAIRLRKEGGVEGYGDTVSGVALMHLYFWGKEPLGAEPTDIGYRGSFDRTWEFVCGGKFSPDHPYYNPMASPEEMEAARVSPRAGDHGGAVLVRERARSYAEGIKKSGWDGEIQFYDTKGEAHVFFLPKHGSDNAVKEPAVVADFGSGNSQRWIQPWRARGGAAGGTKRQRRRGTAAAPPSG
ncbi:hypothetical protein ACP70R_032702 [Stipagrostis hirtigluma subsp. patula]